MSYEILEHTADEKFRATGKSLEEAFNEAVNAFAEIVADGESGSSTYRIEVESESLESLLFDFLDRLIVLQDTEGIIICGGDWVDIEEEKPGYRLEAQLHTDRIDPGGSYMDVKAPTYNEMKAEYSKGEGWVLEAVLDI